MTPRTARRASPLPPAILVVLLSLAAALSPRPAGAQSFDCRAAHYPDEAAICGHPPLGQLDEELARRYQQAGDKLDKDQRAAFEQHEDMFVRARRRCGANVGCIAQSYRNRIGELENMLSADDRDDDSTAAAEDGDAQGQAKRGAKIKEARPEHRAHRPEERAKSETAKIETEPKKVETGATEHGNAITSGQPERRPPANAVSAPPDFAALAPPPPETSEPKPKAKRTAEHPAKRSHHQAAAAPSPSPPGQTGTSTPAASASAPQPQASSNPSAPSIHWVDPPAGH